MLPFRPVDVFTRSRRRLDVRAPVTIGVVLTLVIVLSALYYYTW